MLKTPISRSALDKNPMLGHLLEGSLEYEGTTRRGCISGLTTDLDYCDIEWFALEMNRDHSVIFEIGSKYCISNSFVAHDGYSISSKGFLPTVVDIMVI